MFGSKEPSASPLVLYEGINSLASDMPGQRKQQPGINIAHTSSEFPRHCHRYVLASESRVCICLEKGRRGRGGEQEKRGSI